MRQAAVVEGLDRSRASLTGIAGWYGALLLGAGALVIAVLTIAGASPSQLVPVFLVAGVAAFAVTVLEPRWALVVLLFLLVGYLADRAGGELGLPDGSYRYAPVIAIAVLVRRSVLGTPVDLPPALLAIVALVAATMLSIFGAGEVDVAVERLLDLLQTLVVVVLMVVLIDSPRWLRRAMWAVAIAAAGLSALTVYQQLTTSYDQDFLGLATVTVGTYPRSHGPTNPVFWAQSLAAASMLGLYLWMASRARGARLLALACFGLCTVAIGYTASRGALLAVACALILTAVLRPRQTLLPLAVVAVTIVVAAPSLPDSYVERFASLGSVVTTPTTQTVVSAPEGSLRGRLGESLAAAAMFADHPVLGVGYGNYPPLYREYASEIGLEKRLGERTPHSLILEALSETGLVGTAALLGLLGVALVGAWRARSVLRGSDALLAEGTFVALVALLVAGTFLHISSPRSFFIPVGLALAAGAMARHGAREPESIR